MASSPDPADRPPPLEPVTPRPTPPKDPLPDHIARINVLISAARTAWFGLLSYLAFVGVTLLGVKDADFFIVERQTQLPLVGVSVPTTLFFAFAPALGAMLYAYLHLYLLRLWEALAEPDVPPHGPPLGDLIQPFELANFALGFRPGGLARSDRPLRSLADFASLALAFFGAPLVIAGFWLRSMVKHDAGLTGIFCGIPLSVALFTGATSYVRLRRLMRSNTKIPFRSQFADGAWHAIFFAIFFFGWWTTEGMGIYSPSIARLRNTDFSYIPEGWQDFYPAYEIFHRDWCNAKGLDPAVCGSTPESGTKTYRHEAAARLDWCERYLPSSGGPNNSTIRSRCADYFKNWEVEFESDWKSDRERQRGGLQRRDLSNADLRGADLTGARLEGVDLMKARMQGARLILTRSEGADFRRAQMQGVDFKFAQMQGADFSEAAMIGADLFVAQVQGANFAGAQLDGAKLFLVGIDKSTDLTGATFSGASIRFTNLAPASFPRSQIGSMFGDGSVILPGGVTSVHPDWPAHWPKQVLDPEAFDKQWRLWQSDPAAYRPPDPPAPAP